MRDDAFDAAVAELADVEDEKSCPRWIAPGTLMCNLRPDHIGVAHFDQETGVWWRRAADTAEREHLTPSAGARANVAWLLWCLQQGYAKPEDRAILHNWIGDPGNLTPGDAETRLDLLAMADEVIAAARAVCTATPENRQETP